MSVINFSCPNCQNNLEAQPEYAGMQVNCPHCQTAMIVPQAAAAAPAAPEQPSAPRSKYAKAPSTVQHSVTSPAMAAQIIRKGKKPNYKLYGQIAGGILVLGLAAYFIPMAKEKYDRHQAELKAAEDAKLREAAAKAKKAAEPGPIQILQKLGPTYQGFKSFSVQGQSVSKMDMSQAYPMLKDPINTTASFSMLLGRPSHFRIDWDREGGPKAMKGSAWSAGKGEFVQTGANPVRMKSRDMALSQAAAYSGTLGIYLAGLFFDKTNLLADSMNNFNKIPDETLNGRECYVLEGDLARQHVLFWIRKDDFVVTQIKMVLTGKVDESVFNGLTPAQRKQAEIMAKVKGDITETYDNIDTNRDLAAADFQAGTALPAARVPREAAAPATPGVRGG